MQKNNVLYALIGASAVGAQFADEAHHEHDAIVALFAKKEPSTLTQPAYVRPQHGPEPEGPSWPLRMTTLEAPSSSTATAAVSLSPLVWKSTPPSS